MLPNREEFDKLYEDLEKTHRPLTFIDIGKVFGEDFWIMLVLSVTNIKISADKIDLHIEN